MAALIKEEYEWQLYGHCLRELKVAIKETVEDTITNTFEKVETEMLALENARRPNQLKQDLAYAKVKYFEASTGPIQEAQEVIEEVMNIPDNILIGSDDLHEKYKDVDLSALEKEVKELEDQYIQQKHYKAALQMKKQELEMFQPLHQKVCDIMKKMEVISAQTNQMEKANNDLAQLHQNLHEEFESSCKDKSGNKFIVREDDT